MEGKVDLFPVFQYNVEGFGENLFDIWFVDTLSLSVYQENSAEMSTKLAKLGLAAVLAYGIIDGVTYTSFFVLAFMGYEKTTGNNPAANLQSLLGVSSNSLLLILYFKVIN